MDIGSRSIPKDAVETLEKELQQLDLPPWAFKKYLMTPPIPSLYQGDFNAMGPDPHTGLVSGSQAKPYLERCKLPTSVLHRYVWYGVRVRCLPLQNMESG